MFQHLQLTVVSLINNPKARIVFILGTVVMAALVSGAPSDLGGH